MKRKSFNQNIEIIQEFLVNLKKAVANTGLSSCALAKNIDLPRQAISNALRIDHDPRLSTVIRIVKGMGISMDLLLGIKPDNKSVQNLPVSEVGIKSKTLNLINSIDKMPDQDVELLEGIVELLDERRAHAVAKLFHAVQDTKPPIKNKKDGLLAKASKNGKKSKVFESLSDNDDEFENEDLDDFEDFEDINNDEDEDDEFDDCFGEDDYDDDEDEDDWGLDEE